LGTRFSRRAGMRTSALPLRIAHPCLLLTSVSSPPQFSLQLPRSLHHLRLATVEMGTRATLRCAMLPSILSVQLLADLLERAVKARIVGEDGNVFTSIPSPFAVILNPTPRGDLPTPVDMTFQHHSKDLGVRFPYLPPLSPLMYSPSDLAAHRPLLLLTPSHHRRPLHRAHLSPRPSSRCHRNLPRRHPHPNFRSSIQRRACRSSRRRRGGDRTRRDQPVFPRVERCGRLPVSTFTRRVSSDHDSARQTRRWGRVSALATLPAALRRLLTPHNATRH
jgi:hypothetical protein